jgi:hypothetical protein
MKPEQYQREERVKEREKERKRNIEGERSRARLFKWSRGKKFEET